MEGVKVTIYTDPGCPAEVAELRGVTVDQAREELEAAGAKLVELAGDGYWSTS